ncbi:hypothetical protein [Ahrensia marina]|uniref:DNA-directed DNA polymerase family A palm domain-containing protein n=1 Tax=Ahrensia marina TaxID=1514904 RepID=A0A0N0VMB6_9HYPH|nr:hypothetical protein [Ahrensia marina]KPB02058.1 hypothetical protein SU32_04645 [Ahrensia marina]
MTNSTNDRSLNTERRAGTDESKALVAEAISLVEGFLAKQPIKRNKRRPYDQETFELTLEAVLSDLIYRHSQGFEGGLFLPRSNRLLGTNTRYRPRVWSKALPKILNTLSNPEVALIAQQLGDQTKRRSTTVWPTQRLQELVSHHDVDEDHFISVAPGECIILKSAKDPDDYWNVASYQDYEDDDYTHKLREELQEINDRLERAPISYEYIRGMHPSVPLDTRERSMRRIFTYGSFHKGGRLYGGFWQPMSKDERLRGIRIGNEPVVELDYGQAGSRILYGMAKAPPPENDHYALEGFLGYRTGIKRIMSSMIFANKRLTKFPKGTRQEFPNQETIKDVVKAIEAKHEPIQHLFFKGLGHDMQFIESNIMVAVLKRLNDQGITALPIHDAVLVPKSSIEHSKSVMLEAFQEVAGVPAKVTTEEAT